MYIRVSLETIGFAGTQPIGRRKAKPLHPPPFSFHNPSPTTFHSGHSIKGNAVAYRIELSGTPVFFGGS